ncbi:MAG: hypothetical protein ABDI07_12130, partial [Candidatus Kryptonium sp.]
APGANSVYTVSFNANTVVNLFNIATPPITGPAIIQRGTVNLFQIENKQSGQQMSVSIFPTVDGTFAATLNLTSIGGPQVAELSGSIDYKTGQASIAISGSRGPVPNLEVTLSFVLGFEYNVGNPEIEFEVDKITLRATDRQITARWSLQFEQDLRALYDLDLQSQLVTIIGEQIALDIDREIVNHLFAIATSL